MAMAETAADSHSLSGKEGHRTPRLMISGGIQARIGHFDHDTPTFESGWSAESRCPPRSFRNRLRAALTTRLRNNWRAALMESTVGNVAVSFLRAAPDAEPRSTPFRSVRFHHCLDVYGPLSFHQAVRRENLQISHDESHPFGRLTSVVQRSLDLVAKSTSRAWPDYITFG